MHPQFPQDDQLIYLNHAAVSPWPLCAQQAVSQFAEENVHLGASNYPQWLKVEAQLKTRLAGLINAPSAVDIALLKSTSEALSVIAYGIDWQTGDNVVLSSEEFPSNRIVWESLKALGVETRIVDFRGFDDPESVLIAAMDSRTRLLTSSSVHYASGLRMDLERLGAACQQRSILFCVDAIQSLGAIPFDLQACQADFVVADGHKWMMGPEGLALFYCNPDVRDQLKLQQFGWHMIENAGDYNSTSWQAARTARRFECGSPNTLGAYALNASLGLIEETGIEIIHKKLINNISYLIDKLRYFDSITFHSPTDDTDRMAGIVNFSFADVDSASLYKNLMQQDVICANRGLGVRFSPHFYQSTATLEKGASILREALKNTT